MGVYFLFLKPKIAISARALLKRYFSKGAIKMFLIPSKSGRKTKQNDKALESRCTVLKNVLCHITCNNAERGKKTIFFSWDIEKKVGRRRSFGAKKMPLPPSGIPADFGCPEPLLGAQEEDGGEDK